MQDFPHHYHIVATSTTTSNVTLGAVGLSDIESAPPVQFGGSGDRWSPEDLLTAAVADCFILSFKVVAQGSSLPWQSIECQVEGLLERVDRVTKFTAFTIVAKLVITADVSADKAKRLLEKAEANCLISNSLNAAIHLQCEIVVAE